MTGGAETVGRTAVRLPFASWSKEVEARAGKERLLIANASRKADEVRSCEKENKAKVMTFG
jgi:hypothetical protein